MTANDFSYDKEYFTSIIGVITLHLQILFNTEFSYNFTVCRCLG